MSFRHDGKKSHAFNQWKARNRSDLLRCGVSPSVLGDWRDWWYFLEHGEHPVARFNLTDLSPEQREAMETFLVREYGDDACSAAHVCIIVLRGLAGRVRANAEDGT